GGAAASPRRVRAHPDAPQGAGRHAPGRGDGAARQPGQEDEDQRRIPADDELGLTARLAEIDDPPRHPRSRPAAAGGGAVWGHAMTEAEWQAAKHPYDLIYLPKCRSDRKRRLFACACARRALPFLSDPRFADVVAGCEGFADGAITWKGVLDLRKTLRKAVDDLRAAKSLEWQNHAAGAVGAVTAKEFMHFK